MNLSLEAKRYLDDQELSRLRKTLRTPLMQATKRYVITDTDELVSPAGFHPDDKVLLRPTSRSTPTRWLVCRSAQK